MLRIGVSGAAGRMGVAVLRALRGVDGMALGSALVRAGHPRTCKDAAELAGGEAYGVALDDRLEAVVAACDVVVDFSRPGLLAALAAACAGAGRPLVTGTTGLDEAASAALTDAAGRVPVVAAPNMSIGVNLLFHLVDITSETLPETWTVEVFEAHHANKADAPSGTALRLGEAIERARGMGAVAYRVEREGDIVGIHEAGFKGEGERLTLGHAAQDRIIFARGALRAAAWVHDRPAGSYGMDDVLGLKSRRLG